MKKLNSLMVLAAAALGLGTLVACGPAASSETPSASDTATSEVTPSEDKPSEDKTSEDVPPAESSEDESSEEEPEEELIEMPELKEGSVMTGEFKGFGDGTVDVYLREGNKAFFDVTCYQTMPNVPQEVMNGMFDKEGTYTVENNVYTFTMVWQPTDQKGQPVGDPVTKTHISVYNTRSNVHVLDYVLVGQRELPAKLVGRLPSVDVIGEVSMEGEFKGFGDGTVKLTLKEDGKAFFDATCYQTMPNVPQEVMNGMFDKEATYTVAGNVYTFTVVWQPTDQKGQPVGDPITKTHISVWDEETQTHTLDYVLVGQRELPARLTGKLCK